MADMFDEYVKSRTLQNWKFWIVSLGFLCPVPSHTSVSKQQTHTLVPLERVCARLSARSRRAMLASALRDGTGQARAVGGSRPR